MEFFHDFSALGLSLPQHRGIYAANQAAKAPIISSYLRQAIDALKHEGVAPIALIELFCADAYYSYLAANWGVDRCDAFDSNIHGHLDEACYIKQALGAEGVHLHERDVFDIPADMSASIVINAGGLYHVRDPLKSLDMAFAMTERFLIVQSVVSLAHEEETYLESPAPGVNHGSRFSAAFLAKAIRDRGMNVLRRDDNVLTGNTRPDDRGSVYFLIQK